MAESVPLLLKDGTTSFVYGPAGLPVEEITSSGAVAYYHHDQLGSTRLLTNGTGAILATYTYDAYGNLTGSTGKVTNPLGYAGQYTDSELGLQYLRARYYDPATAQFLGRDPLVKVTGEPYGYVNGNPLNNIDPLGLSGCPPASAAGARGPSSASTQSSSEMSNLLSTALFVGSFFSKTLSAYSDARDASQLPDVSKNRAVNVAYRVVLAVLVIGLDLESHVVVEYIPGTDPYSSPQPIQG